MQNENTVDRAVGHGSVNFNSNVVSQHEATQSAAVEAAPQQDTHTLGNVRILGPVVEEAAVKVSMPVMHTIGLALHITLNTGLTFLKGRKELKTVDIERDGKVEKFNFYNPFLKEDKDRNTGAGLLRKTFGSIAKAAHTVLGREAIYVGSDDNNIVESIRSIASALHTNLLSKFPLSQDEALFNVNVELNTGEIAVRPVVFGELFSITSWTEVATDDEACVTTHTVHFNIGLNIGALYDSSSPVEFVRRAETFLDAQLKSLGLSDVVPHSVGYAFASSTLNDSKIRDLMELLITESQYTVVSKSSVEDGKVAWAPSADSQKLFGYDCDLMLLSPEGSVTEEE